MLKVYENLDLDNYFKIFEFYEKVWKNFRSVKIFKNWGVAKKILKFCPGFIRNFQKNWWLEQIRNRLVCSCLICSVPVPQIYNLFCSCSVLRAWNRTEQNRTGTEQEQNRLSRNTKTLVWKWFIYANAYFFAGLKTAWKSRKTRF